jgi:hypothetical protein
MNGGMSSTWILDFLESRSCTVRSLGWTYGVENCTSFSYIRHKSEFLHLLMHEVLDRAKCFHGSSRGTINTRRNDHISVYSPLLASFNNSVYRLAVAHFSQNL